MTREITFASKHPVTYIVLGTTALTFCMGIVAVFLSIGLGGF